MLVANYRSSRYCQLGLFQTDSNLAATTFTSLDIPALQQIGREGKIIFGLSLNLIGIPQQKKSQDMAFSTSVAQEKAAESILATVSQVHSLKTLKIIRSEWNVYLVL